MKSKWTISLLAVSVTSGMAFAEDITQIEYTEVEPRIVGGGPAAAQDWKFYTQIVSHSSNRSYCGASYIGNGYVLTAAHCVDGDAPSQIAVKIGGVIYNGTDGVRENVSEIHIHPSYNSINLDNDIALLKLASIPQGAVPVEIADGSLSQYAVVGDWLTVAGLGRTSEGGSSPSVLQEVDVPLISDATCRQAGGSYSNVGAVSFCAGVPEGGIDSCQGDSGGPIVINRSGVITQLGIVSWGIGCARPGKYGVYSDIAALRSFVNQVTGSNPPSETVSVGYTANQTLTSFKVGELKQHVFTVKNNGTANFTVDNISLVGSGVALNPMIAQDRCSMTTLSSGAQCGVTVEFGASAVGTANVQMNFGIDKTTTTYRANVSATANSDLPPTGSCQNEWLPSQVYQTGEQVSWNGQTWQAQWWTQGDNPSESGPWGVWQAVSPSDCSSTTTPPPTEPPTLPPTDGIAYQAGTSYSEGDVVTNNGSTYQCKPWPYSLWCGSTPSAYEPGVGTNWQDAWLQL